MADLRDASYQGDLQAVKDLISNGVDVNEPDWVMESFNNLDCMFCYVQLIFVMHSTTTFPFRLLLLGIILRLLNTYCLRAPLLISKMELVISYVILSC